MAYSSACIPMWAWCIPLGVMWGHALSPSLIVYVSALKFCVYKRCSICVLHECTYELCRGAKHVNRQVHHVVSMIMHIIVIYSILSTHVMGSGMHYIH